MPEGPEVHTIVDKLGPLLKGKHLVSINRDSSSKYRDGLVGYDQLALYLPILIEDVTCKGKQIFFHLIRTYQVDGIDYVQRYYINCTLGMEGKWIWEPEKHSNLWFELADSASISPGFNGFPISFSIMSDSLYFDDSRHFGNVSILTPAEYQNKIGTIGPDLLTDHITDEMWLSKTQNARLVNKQICDFLMEQKYFSGVGNYLKAEILYDAKIKPDRTLSNLSREDLLAIKKSSQQKINQSYQCNGLTIRSYLSPDGQRGTFQQVVYGKNADPLGNKVVKDKFKDGRTTHWVPAVQI